MEPIEEELVGIGWPVDEPDVAAYVASMTDQGDPVAKCARCGLWVLKFVDNTLYPHYRFIAGVTYHRVPTPGIDEIEVCPGSDLQALARLIEQLRTPRYELV